MLFLVPVIYRILEDFHILFDSSTVEAIPTTADDSPSLDEAPAAPSPA